jgi:muconolactone delta-isomerase
MEFLVRAENRMAPDTPEEERNRLRMSERGRAEELREAGILRRLWRVPGRNAWVGLFEVPDATVLHDVLASLPMFPWLDVTVEAVATHPQEQ